MRYLLAAAAALCMASSASATAWINKMRLHGSGVVTDVNVDYGFCLDRVCADVQPAYKIGDEFSVWVHIVFENSVSTIGHQIVSTFEFSFKSLGLGYYNTRGRFEFMDGELVSIDLGSDTFMPGCHSMSSGLIGNGSSFTATGSYTTGVCDDNPYTDMALLTRARGVGEFTAIYINDPMPSIPEPATWAMLIAGFGLVGAAARRRRLTESQSA